MKRRAVAVGCFLMLLAALGVASVSPGHAQGESFYKGKTLKVLVGTTAGSLYDIWARTVAAHLPRHIPGKSGFARAEHAWGRPQDCHQLHV